MTSRRETIKHLGAWGMAMLAPSLSRAAVAQSLNAKPVRVTTPFPPGSGPDVALRLIAEQMAKKLGEPVVVENKSGGNGFIAVAAFKNGSLDGHDLIELDNTHTTTHPHTFAKLPYDVQKDFVPLAMILRASFFVVVGASSPFKSIDDIVAAAKARRVTYGSWFVGSPGHIGALRLQSMKDIEMTHVPYRDFGQLYGAVANQEVDWALGSIASAGGFERAGRLRFLAIAAPTRDPLYPDVPATAELPSVRGYEVSGWAGLFGPGALPTPTRDRLAGEIADALAVPEVIERYRTLGYEAPKLSPDDFALLIRKETAGWAEVIRVAHLRLD
jgi:tripartite-type tricarboxylate transporter receptor subunit TctC